MMAGPAAGAAARSAAEPYAFEVSTPAPGVTLHLHRSMRRKTQRIAVYWLGDLDEREITARALLGAVLTRGTVSHPDLRAMGRHEEWLYGASLQADGAKIGERHLIGLRADFASDRYLPAGQAILPQVVDFLAEAMRAPYLEHGAFPPAVLAQEKVNHRRLIESLINDKPAYAHQRCLATLCAGEPFGIHEHGRVEDLEAIDSARMLALLEQSNRAASTHIYFTGDLELSAAAQALAPLIDPRRTAPSALRARSAPRAARRPVCTVRESLDVIQASLVLGYRTGIRHGDALAPALAVANALFGALPHSKLFQNVREQAGLCYSIGSHAERSQGLLFVAAGIEPTAFEQARDLIAVQLADMQAGRFADDELADTITALDNRLLMMEDNPTQLIGVDLTWAVADQHYDHAGYRQALRSVTRDAVMAAMHRVELDTIYLLERG